MSGTSPDAGYIRGGAAAPVDPGRVAAVLALGLVASLAAVSGYLFAQTAAHNASVDRLVARGRPVEATVRGCTAISDGIGMGVVYYDCRGSAVLDGRRYDGLIHGNRIDRPTGSRVAAVVLPGQDASLTLASAATASKRSSYLPAWVLSALTAVAAVTVGAWLVRRRRPVPRPHLTPG